MKRQMLLVKVLHRKRNESIRNKTKEREIKWEDDSKKHAVSRLLNLAQLKQGRVENDWEGLRQNMDRRMLIRLD